MEYYIATDIELNAIANALNSKAGHVGPLAFPSEFYSIADSFGDNAPDLIQNKLTYYEDSTATEVPIAAFGECTKLLSVSFPNCRTISTYAFRRCSKLKTLFFPNCITIGSGAFYSCWSITNASFPNCKYIESNGAFQRCSLLTTIYFPKCESIGASAFCLANVHSAELPECKTVGESAFYGCHNLSTVSMAKCTTIATGAFRSCYKLVSMYLLSTAVAVLEKSVAFASTPISNYTASTGGVYGSIYVPSSLVSQYKTATNWTYYADRITSA